MHVHTSNIQINKQVFVLSSQFFSKLYLTKYNGVKNWYRKVSVDMIGVIFIIYIQVNLFQQDLLLCIINAGSMHWTLLVKK